MDQMSLRAQAARKPDYRGPWAAQNEISACYDSYFDAFKAKAIDAVMAVMTPDFSWSLPDGTTLDRKATKSAIEAQMSATLSIQEFSGCIRSVSVDGDAAVVELTEKLMATMKTDQGGTQLVSSREIYRDLWKKTEGTWRLQASELLTSMSGVDDTRG